MREIDPQVRTPGGKKLNGQPIADFWPTFLMAVHGTRSLAILIPEPLKTFSEIFSKRVKTGYDK
jgi:hypothetical protein